MDFQKWKFSLFCQKHALLMSTSFGVFVVTNRVANFLPLWNKLNFQFPILSNCRSSYVRWLHHARQQRLQQKRCGRRLHPTCGLGSNQNLWKVHHGLWAHRNPCQVALSRLALARYTVSRDHGPLASHWPGKTQLTSINAALLYPNPPPPNANPKVGL